ncbi:MAG: hypothetical protein HND58_17265 [Planctomycetota bacterium]|nr:MAG: hypothetical protein HND58_17265 [Planctomycetota bacterium]
MRLTTEHEQLADRWAAAHLLLTDIATGRDHTPEGDEVGLEERGNRHIPHICNDVGRNLLDIEAANMRHHCSVRVARNRLPRGEHIR